MGKYVTKDLPSSLETTYNMLKCAYPNGCPERDYIPLVALLAEHMNYRGVAEVLDLAGIREYHETLGYVYGINEMIGPGLKEEMERIKEELLRCGYEQWVQEDELGGASLDPRPLDES